MSECSFYVLTGGPGSGKSTLLDALEKLGYTRTIEAGRGIIQDQVAIAGRALPWDDRAAFAELMLSWEMRSYRMAERESGIVFFDRAVRDVIGYLHACKLAVPAPMIEAARNFRYNHRVFIAPPWRQLFHTDAERKRDFAEAVRTYEAMVQTYTEFGDDLIELPCRSVEERVAFVLENLGSR